VYREGLANDQHVLSLGDVCEAMVLLGRSDTAAALRVAQSISPAGIAVRPFCMRVLGEAQVACGDLAGGRETAELMAGDGPGAPYPAAVSAWLNGLVSQAGDEPEAAAEAFGRAADGFAALTMPYEAAVARLDWADVITSASGSAEVRGVAAAAVTGHLEELDRMGARPLANRTRRLLRRLGARPTPAPRVRVPGRLSARESEIARLVAEGLSNPDIADRLFISQRTVTTHLQHIYRRLGVDSRTGLTRWVIENLPAEHRIT
jgi:DNA-binding NarL/FixJ family response regulator